VGESRYQPTIELCEEGHSVTLVHERDNSHDPRAIVVEWLPGEPVGYIPRDSWVHTLLLDQQKAYSAHIDYIGRAEGGALGVVIKVTIRGAKEKISVRSVSETAGLAAAAKKSGCLLFGLALFVGLALASPALAHPGGLAADGCHKERATGTRHCHSGTPAPPPRARSTAPRPEPARQSLLSEPLDTSGTTTSAATWSEQELLDLFRRLSPDDRETLLRVARGLAK